MAELQAWLHASGERLVNVPWPAWACFALGLASAFAFPAVVPRLKGSQEKKNNLILAAKLLGVLFVAVGLVVTVW